MHDSFVTKMCLLLLVAVCQLGCNKKGADNGEIALVQPERVGMNSDSLNQIDYYLNQFIDSGYIVGGVVLVAKDNQVVYYKAVGHSDRAKTTPLTTDHIFRIASMTKPIITAAVMQLYEKGKLGLHDPVSKYISAFKQMQVIDHFNPDDSSYTTRHANKEITIHHLLTHTSGLAYGVFHPVAGPVYSTFGVTETWSKDTVTLSTNVPRMAALPLLHDPGEQFTYGVSTEVLARIVEIVSDLPLDEYLRRHIFDPLKMEDTHFYLPGEKAYRLVDVWYRGEFTSESFPSPIRDDYPVAGSRRYFSGGGGLSSTAKDYYRFARTLLNGGSFNGHQILKPATVTLMMTNQIGDLYAHQDAVRFGYGGALHVKDDAFGKRKGRWSWGGFWQTNFWIDPSRNMVVVVMTNAFDTPRYDAFFNGLEGMINNAVIE